MFLISMEEMGKMNKYSVPLLMAYQTTENFIKAYSAPGVTIPYKNVKVSKIIDDLEQEKRQIRSDYYLDYHNEILENSLDQDMDLSEMNYIIDKLFDSEFSLDELTEIIEDENIEYIPNAFLSTMDIRSIYGLCLEQILFSDIPIALRCEMLEDMIGNCKNIKELKGKLSYFGEFEYLADEEPVRIWENYGYKQEELQSYFKENSIKFQQALMFTPNSILIIKALHDRAFINYDQLIMETKENQKQSVLSICFDEAAKYSKDYETICRNICIPKDVRDNDDIAIIKKIDIKELYRVINHSQFILTEQKLDVILRRIQKHVLESDDFAPIEKIYDALNNKSSVTETDLDRVSTQISSKTINERRKLIQKLISILRFVSKQSEDIQVGEVLTRVRARKDEN